MKTLVLILLSFAIAFYLGGSGNTSGLGLSILLGLATSIIALLWQRGMAKRVVVVLVAIVFTYIGYRFGSAEFSNAYNDCVQRAEQTRLAILAFHSKQGRFPSTIDEADLNTCGRRIFRPQLLSYTPKGNDFELSFSDSFVTWRGSKSEPMEARK